MKRVGVALALLPVIAANAALAHTPFGGAASFYGGLLHPVLVPTHALSVLATGLLLAQQALRWPWLPPAAYGAGLALGFAAMMMSSYLVDSAGEALLALGAVSGAAAALARPLPAAFTTLLALATGAALALDSGPGGISVRDANVAVTGTFCGALILLLAVTEVTTHLSREWQKIGVRILGSWISASAVLVLTLRLAR